MATRTHKTRTPQLIDETRKSLGLDPNGQFFPASTTTYLSTAKTFKEALDILDATVAANAAADTALTNDQIAAIDNAIGPDATNPFATINDLPAIDITGVGAPSDAVQSSLVVDMTNPNADLTYTAKGYGTAGDSITVAHIDPGVPSASLQVVFTDTEVTVNLATTSPSNAAKAIGGITYAAVEAGVAGNSITVTHVDSANNNEALAVAVVGTDITVTLATDGTSTPTSTEVEVAAAITNSPEASALVYAIPVTGGATVAAAAPQTALEAGDDGGAIASYASEVKAAVNAELLCPVTCEDETNGSGVVNATVATNLAGGVDMTPGVVGRLYYNTVDQEMYMPIDNIQWQKWSFGSVTKKVYTAFLTQAGTAAPVATVLNNTIGAIAIARSAAGTYTFTLANAFVLNKTVPVEDIYVDDAGDKYKLVRTSANVMTLTTYESADLNTPADDILSGRYINIEVYN